MARAVFGLGYQSSIAKNFGTTVDYLAARLDGEIAAVQADRFSNDNLIPQHIFGPNVTGQLDVMPVFIRRPTSGDADEQRLYYSGARG
jgi:hypothetical protein